MSRPHYVYVGITVSDITKPCSWSICYCIPRTGLDPGAYLGIRSRWGKSGIKKMSYHQSQGGGGPKYAPGIDIGTTRHTYTYVQVPRSAIKPSS